MTIAELISSLGRFPPDARVVIPHLHAGFNDVIGVREVPIHVGKPSDKAFGRGIHTDQRSIGDDAFVPDEVAVVIDWG
ncbi:hypothetical protein [Paraburkholderia dinghuensis]|uniref:Uncharacterized protein n=1 Tax=Paraburkholderia dinghuensis TaxID=2305225 RepID=A0A3N6M931_9BURK|nr:hypothetical protein [Paraburkholderia dinghuensis]RQH00199.1 hypothetical protein D1Y85_25520 [Paraburkholderia dinghuensis]